MGAVAVARQTLTLMVPKTTGTPGDTLVAWGLAIFVYEALADQRVVLSDRGTHFLVETSVPYERLENVSETFSWQQRLALSRLLWLASAQKGRTPQRDSMVDQIDRDELREAYRHWRENRRLVGQPLNGDAPASTTKVDPRLYPFYETLTNPGTQWAGYNSFVERLYSALTPDGARSLIAQFDLRDTRSQSESGPVKRSAKVPMFNPPGFLYPGMNKGPTMRMTSDQGITIGSGSAGDWTLVDRGDRTLFENYLAYVGYFQVARMVTTKEQRVIAVPISRRTQIRVILGNLPGRELEATNLTDYLAAQNALDYGEAALGYLVSLQGTDAGSAALEQRGMALEGVHLSVFWRPNGNVFAPRRVTQVPLPAWLPALREQSLTVASETLKQHRARLKSLRGPRRDENKVSSEQRQAIESYLHALNGDLLAWFEAVAAWFPAARAAARGNWNVGLWSTEEVRRIALAMRTTHDQATLTQLLDAPEFKRLASTIRLSTVVPHIARERRRKNPAIEASPWDIRYDLPTRLRQAAERGPKEFLREFYAFIASYNDETARPKTGRGRPLARTDDLVWLSKQVDNPAWSKTLPAALLAFGTSLRGKPATPADGDGEHEPEDDLSGDGPDAEDAAEGEE